MADTGEQTRTDLDFLFINFFKFIHLFTSYSHGEVNAAGRVFLNSTTTLAHYRICCWLDKWKTFM